MKLLFDQNLSRHLVGQLRDVYPESEHVPALGLDAATDQEIWRYAGEHGHVIVSKDSPRPESQHPYYRRTRRLTGLRPEAPHRA